jgi:drug/metabolite transporter (DMT)-like permease
MGARYAGGVGLMIAGVVVLVMSGLALFFTSYEIQVTFLVVGVVFIAVGSQRRRHADQRGPAKGPNL